VKRRTYAVLVGLGLLGALAAARLIKSATPVAPEAVVDRHLVPPRADAGPGANVGNDDVVGARGERATFEPRPAPEPQERVGSDAPEVPPASQTRLALALLVILALIAAILLLFLKEFLA
jgi:hypothetical protein